MIPRHISEDAYRIFTSTEVIILPSATNRSFGGSKVISFCSLCCRQFIVWNLTHMLFGIEIEALQRMIRSLSSDYVPKPAPLSVTKLTLLYCWQRYQINLHITSFINRVGGSLIRVTNKDPSTTINRQHLTSKSTMELFSRERDEGLYMPNCLSSLFYALSLLFLNFINTTAYYLGQIQAFISP